MPARVHIHAKLDPKINQQLRLIAFIRKTSRDNVLNEILVRVLPSEMNKYRTEIEAFRNG